MNLQNEEKKDTPKHYRLNSFSQNLHHTEKTVRFIHAPFIFGENMLYKLENKSFSDINTNHCVHPLLSIHRMGQEWALD